MFNDPRRESQKIPIDSVTYLRIKQSLHGASISFEDCGKNCLTPKFTPAREADDPGFEILLNCSKLSSSAADLKLELALSLAGNNAVKYDLQDLTLALIFPSLETSILGELERIGHSVLVFAPLCPHFTYQFSFEDGAGSAIRLPHPPGTLRHALKEDPEN